MKSRFLVGLLIGLLLACGQAENTVEQPTWEIFKTGTSASLRGLSVVDDQVVWASGSKGTWLRSTDGGKTWQQGIIAGMDSVDFRDIEAFSDQVAIAISAGQPAVIYKTTDGGQTWDLKFQETDSTAFFDGLDFWDVEKGLLMGDPVGGQWYILKTIDAGETWTRLANAPVAMEGEAAFAASGTSIVTHEMDKAYIGTGGAVSRLLFTEDGGESWKAMNSPIKQGLASQGIFALAVDSKAIYAVGGDYAAPEDTIQNAVTTFDQGLQWRITVNYPPKGYRSGLALREDPALWVCVGTTGSDYSYDGLAWMPFSEEGFHTVKRAKGGSSFWASGNNGKVARLLTP